MPRPLVEVEAALPHAERSGGARTLGAGVGHDERMQPADVVAALRPHLGSALVATDFDGTLAPLQRDPEASRPVPGAIEALTALTGRGARVAVVTGRDAATAVRLGGLEAVPGLVVAGLYGLETWSDGELHSPGTPEAIEALRERLPKTLAGADADPAIWIEDKRLSLVVHARRADDPATALTGVEAAVAALADDLGLELHPGSGVLELRVPGFDKGRAIGRLVEEAGASAALYLGDDLGDLPGFETIRSLRRAGLPAWSIGVTASGADGLAEAVDAVLPDPEACVALLRELAS